METSLRFVPSEVQGLTAVTEATVFPDRMELLSNGQLVVIRFLEIARWRRCGWIYRPLAQLGFTVGGRPAVADRDWFHPPSRRFFRFFTEPKITIYLPDESRDTTYGDTLFRRIQEVILLGGFITNDLG